MKNRMLKMLPLLALLFGMNAAAADEQKEEPKDDGTPAEEPAKDEPKADNSLILNETNVDQLLFGLFKGKEEPKKDEKMMPAKKAPDKEEAEEAEEAMPAKEKEAKGNSLDLSEVNVHQFLIDTVLNLLSKAKVEPAKIKEVEKGLKAMPPAAAPAAAPAEMPSK